MRPAYICLSFVSSILPLSLSAGTSHAADPGSCIHRPAPAGTKAKRVAIVVGESAYAHGIPVLPNPTNDAEATAKALATLGFETFASANSTAKDLQACLDQAYAGLADAEVALFYYSGHGIQIKDENYLVATDASLGDFNHGFVPVQPIVDALQKQAKATLVLLDACRNNPMAEQGHAGLSVSTGRGLSRAKDARAEPPASDKPGVVQARGLMVAYSTSPNAVARDGTGHLSPFTDAFVKHVGTSGYSIQHVMSDVTKAVGEETQWEQTPWMKSSLTSELKLGGGETLAEAKSISDNHAARAQSLLDVDGNRPAAVVEALKGLPPTPNEAALKTFAKAYLALYSAVQGKEIVLPITPGMANVAVSTQNRAAVFKRNADVTSGVLELWSVSEQKLIAKPPVGRDVWKFTFSPHGNMLVTAGQGGATVWNGLDGSKLFELRGKGFVSSMEFSPDEKRLMLVGSETITVVDVATRKPTNVVRAGQLGAGLGKRRGGSLAQATFGGNDAICFILSNYGAGGSKGILGVFDLKENKTAHLHDTGEAVTVMMCDPQGKYMVRTFAVGAGEQGMEIWDLKNDTVKKIKGPIVNIMGIDPKGDYVSVLAFANEYQGFWDLATGKKGQPPSVPDGYWILGSRLRNENGGLVSQDISPNPWRDWPDETLYAPALVKKAMAALTPEKRDEVARERINYVDVAANP